MENDKNRNRNSTKTGKQRKKPKFSLNPVLEYDNQQSDTQKHPDKSSKSSNRKKGATKIIRSEKHKTQKKDKDTNHRIKKDRITIKNIMVNAFFHKIRYGLVSYINITKG